MKTSNAWNKKPTNLSVTFLIFWVIVSCNLLQLKVLCVCLSVSFQEKYSLSLLSLVPLLMKRIEAGFSISTFGGT